MKRHFWLSLVVLVIIAVIAVVIAAYVPVSQPAQAPAAGASNETPFLFPGNQNSAPVVYLEGTTPSGSPE